MLGIIGAMDEEVAKIKQEMNSVDIYQAAGMDFFQGKIGQKDVVVVRSGIGKVNAALCSQILVNHFHVDQIINTGIAGSLKKGIKIGDIVLSTDAVQHDVDATQWGYQYGEIPRMAVTAFPADENLIKLAKACCEKVNPDIHVHLGRVLSGDQFVSDNQKKAWLIETFSGCCTEMEGAAVAQAAYLNKVPYLVIRSISDQADEAATLDYAEFEQAAIEHSTRLALAMIEAL